MFELLDNQFQKKKTLFQLFETVDWLCWGLTTRQPLWVILCRLPEKGRSEIEEIVEEEMKERNRGERGKWMKVKTQMKFNIPPLPIPAARTAGHAQL